MNSFLKNNDTIKKVMYSIRRNQLLDNYSKNFYNELADYIYTFNTIQEYKYKLILSDEFENIYKAFSIIQESIKPVEYYGEFFNKDSLNELKEELKENKDAKVLIIDFATFNGKNFNKIINELNEFIPKNHIYLWTYRFYNKCVDIAFDRFEIATKTTLAQYEEVLNHTNHFINEANLGITNNYDVYYTNYSNAKILIKKLEQKSYFICRDFDEQINDKIAIIKPDKVNNERIIKLFRFKTNGNNVTIIPTVILPPYEKNKCRKKCIKLLEKNNINIPEEVLEYNELNLYKWTTSILSKKLWKKHSNNMKYYCIENKTSYKEINDSNDIFGKSHFETISYNLNDKSDIVEYYLDSINNEDISIHDMIEVLKNQNYSPEFICSIIANTIWNYESFKASYDIKDNDNYIGGFIKDGPRNYALKFELLSKKTLQLMYNYVMQTGKIDFKDYLNSLNEIINKKNIDNISELEIWNELFKTYPNNINTHEHINKIKKKKLN